MIKIPPFRVFTHPYGLPTTMPKPFAQWGKESNLSVDIPTFAYWYWMMCSITIDLGYTINGGVEVPIRQQIHVDAKKYLPQNRITGRWAMDTPVIHDDELEITTTCCLLLNEPCFDTLPPSLIEAPYTNDHVERPCLHYHPKRSLPENTRFGLCFKFESHADNRDFTLCTLPSDRPKHPFATFNARFLDQTVPFYISTPYPQDISMRIDFIHITPEFFEIDIPPLYPPNF